MGRAIGWVQYLPLKLIKHGIKVFALCCSNTGYLYSFEIYTGKRTDTDGSAKAVVVRLLTAAGIVVGAVASGRILYMDNWYMSLDLVKHSWIKYGIMVVGTVVLTKKKSRVGSDFPFAKLSGRAMQLIPRGWGRRATQEIDGGAIHGKCKVQATVWRDKRWWHTCTTTRSAPMMVEQCSAGIHQPGSMWKYHVHR